MRPIRDGDEYQRMRDGEPRLVVFFHQPKCKWCAKLAPILDKAERRLKGKARFAKVDADAHGDVAGAVRVDEVPCIILYEAGRELGRFEGYLPGIAKELEKAITKPGGKA